MRMLHPVSGEEFEVNPADQEDHDTLLKNGWKPVKGKSAPKEDKEEDAGEPETPVAPVARKKRKSKADPQPE